MTKGGGVRRSTGIVLIGLCVVGPLLDLLSDVPLPSERLERIRRALLNVSDDEGQQQEQGQPLVYPWARKYIRPLDAAPDRSRKEVAVFWHIPRSGGTTIKTIYECMGLTLAKNAGVDPRYGNQDKQEIIAFHPWPGVSRASYTNVDTTSRQGMQRAKRLKLVPSGLADLIITSDLPYAMEELFDGSHKGRVLALFRHPVERLVSKFHYLRSATWEQQYRPQWNRLSVEKWAATKNTDTNHMVKKLAGLVVNDTVAQEDLRLAMRTIRKRFVVGLVDQMEESVRRFNTVLGVDDESNGENKKCMNRFFGRLREDVKGTGANPHPEIHRGGRAWNALAETNALDVRLYEFVAGVFEEQREVVDAYRIRPPIEERGR